MKMLFWSLAVLSVWLLVNGVLWAFLGRPFDWGQFWVVAAVCWAAVFTFPYCGWG